MISKNFFKRFEYSKFDISILNTDNVYSFLKECQDKTIIEYYINESQNYLENTDQHGRTLLHLLCYLNNNSSVEYLLENYNCNINIGDINGSHPIHFACQRGEIDIIKNLVNNGANVKVKNNWGITPLHYLFQGIKESSMQSINILLKEGASFDEKDKNNTTPVTWALKSQEMDTIINIVDKTRIMKRRITKDEMGALFNNIKLDINEIVEIIKYIVNI
jgi:ankyrin repeat protein